MKNVDRSADMPAHTQHTAKPAHQLFAPESADQWLSDQLSVPLPESAPTGPVVVSPLDDARLSMARPRPDIVPAIQAQRSQVHVAPDLLDLVSIATTTAEATEQRRKRDLNEVVHMVLIVGLFLSTTFMLLGIGLALVRQYDLPHTVPDLNEVVRRVVALRPSGFLALGLIILIITPILRVIGSIVAFIYERDWRFAGITSLVFLIMLISIVLGKG